MSRLAHGGLIDRSSPASFRFDGRLLHGFAGDTLASALVANDVKLVGRSFKYHRPRGILSAGNEEPNALVSLRGDARAEPNTRATTIELFEGLSATSQNRWPSLRFDAMAVNQLFAPLLVAGFYYKTFMWPARFWEKLYEPVIRRAAGLGALSGLPDPDLYDREHGFCDLLIVGGGAAGLAAALTAGAAGLRVIVAETDFLFGGRLLSERHSVEDLASGEWARAAAASLAAMPNVRLLPRTSVFGVYDGRVYGAIERVSDHLAAIGPGQPRQRYWKIVAKQTILATGAIERPLVFGGNDRPGVMMASAVSTYVNRFAALPGRRAVIFTTSDSGWQTATDLLDAGATVEAVVEARAEAPAMAADLKRRGVAVFTGAAVRDAHGAPLRRVEIVAQGKAHRLEVDLLAVAGGWDPAIGLASNLGARPRWSHRHESFLVNEGPPGLAAAGAAAGNWSLGAALRDGQATARSAIAALGMRVPRMDDLRASDDPGDVAPLWRVGEHRTKAFVDFQNDVTDRDIELAAREGFVSVEHLKRYTTLGMATDQGKSSNVNGHALLAETTGKAIADAGTILSRPPYHPVALGALAGHHRGEQFRPVRQTSTHIWAEEMGAVFVEAEQWKRARWFVQTGDADWVDSVNREVSATRNGVGICDVSTLGKIEIHGPDAATMLDRLYINSFSHLPVGKARYGVMLREDGFVFDDGTVTRFAEDRFFVTTTTANAALVTQHVDFARQVLWPDLDVQATSVTEQWATFSVAGPRARSLAQLAFPDADLSNDSFPYLAAAECSWNSSPAKIFRLSFSGELAYELSVPATEGERFVRFLFKAGHALGVVAYGTEALSVMRIEKGHPAGPELNGQTTPVDLGMARMMSTKKDFVGRVMAARPGLVDPARPALVGLKPVAIRDRFTAGAHLIRPGHSVAAANDEGHVTSVAHSPTLGHSIALALLARGPERHGERILAVDPIRGSSIEAEICSPVFLDPDGTWVRG